MSTPVVLTIIATVFWGVGAAMQKHGMATEFPKISLKNLFSQIFTVIKTLLLNPIWLLGLVSMLGGMFTFAYALAAGDISLVQPLVNLTIVWAALVGVIFLHEKVTPIEWVGIAIVLAGAFIIGIGAGEATSSEPSMMVILAIMLGFALATGICLILGKTNLNLKIEFTLSLAAGFTLGLANVIGKVMTQRVITEVGEFDLINPACLLALITDFPVYVVMGTNVLGAIFMQTAFANGRVSLVSPVITITANTTPIIVAIAAFNETVGWAHGIGIGLAVLGTAFLALKKDEIDES